jgi:hypothetical protein
LSLTSFEWTQHQNLFKRQLEGSRWPLSFQVLIFSWVSESPGGLFKTQVAGPTHRIVDWMA